MMNKMGETNGINSIIQSEDVDHFNSLIEEFHCYFPRVEHNTPMMQQGTLPEFMLKIFQMNQMKMKVFNKSFWI